MTAFGTKAFTYSSENLLKTGPNGTTLSYDPLGRLYQVTGPSGTRLLLYDGLDRIGEYDGSGGWLADHVHGVGDDEPILVHDGGGPRALLSDERGSIVAVTADVTGALVGANRYDEYGQPQAGNIELFGYTGQAWLPDVGAWYYKARIYDPELGRFLQADPVGYADSLNLYAYLLNDPVNASDPLGLRSPTSLSQECGLEVYPPVVEVGVLAA